MDRRFKNNQLPRWVFLSFHQTKSVRGQSSCWVKFLCLFVLTPLACLFHPSSFRAHGGGWSSCQENRIPVSWLKQGEKSEQIYSFLFMAKTFPQTLLYSFQWPLLGERRKKYRHLGMLMHRIKLAFCPQEEWENEAREATQNIFRGRNNKGACGMTSACFNWNSSGQEEKPPWGCLQEAFSPE